MNDIFSYPTVLSVAGSDSSGGAGVQADVKTISALGAYAATAITAITVQNTLGVQAVHPVQADVVGAQMEAVMSDLALDAVKIGMVGDASVIRAIARQLRRHPVPMVICDPVMVSTSGHRLMSGEAMEALVDELFPLCTLITPNLPEAEALLGCRIRTSDEMEGAIYDLCQWGTYAVLLKGGHLEGEVMADFLLMPDADEPLAFQSPKVDTPNTHGTGCTLSSAIAALVARGQSLPEAIRQAKQYVSEAIRQGADVRVGHGHGPLNHFFFPLPLKKFSPTEGKKLAGIQDEHEATSGQG